MSWGFGGIAGLVCLESCLMAFQCKQKDHRVRFGVHIALGLDVEFKTVHSEIRQISARAVHELYCMEI